MEIDNDVEFTVWKDSDGYWWGRDEHGDYRLRAGTSEPPDQDDYDYQVCGTTLTYTFERYGERRYCTAMAEANFVEDGSDFCKVHRGRENIMAQHEENFKHGAFAQSYEGIFRYLKPHKQIVAIDLLDSLLDESTHDFEREYVSMEVDVSESDFVEAESVEMDFPVPTENTARGQALWYAAINLIQMQNMHEQQFEAAAEDDVAVGERMQVVSVTDDGRVVEDEAEHHLNLPISRIQKDYESHLEFGGVSIEGGDQTADVGERTWVVELGPEDDPPEMEKSGHVDTSPMDRLDEPTEVVEDAED